MVTEVEVRLAAQVQALPTSPGVYLMKDAAGAIIYVGKAVNLRNRVRSYFGSGNGHSPKTRKLVQKIHDFEIIVTDTELEALILECNLIKRHRPRYNVVMKDDKSYPYIRVDLSSDWGRVEFTRRVMDDGAKYFGPFADASAVWRTLELLKKLFPYRSCTKPITGTDDRPCLDYHIKRCLGPCIGAVSQEEYRDVLKQVALFLEGKQDTVVKQLRAKMHQAAENLEFERASFLRDQILAVEKVVERQKVFSTTLGDEDVIAFAREQDAACVQVFFVRGGKLIGREHFMLDGSSEDDDREVMTSFLKQFYDSAAFVPPRVVLQNTVHEAAIIEQWLKRKRGERVSLLVPRQGEQRKLVEMVAENAQQTLEQVRAKWLADSSNTLQALEEIQAALGLPALPWRIECYDISNTQGRASVASMVVFEDGKPARSQYRRFQIKTVVGANDFASMQEVLRRRLKRVEQLKPAPEPNGANGASAAGRSDSFQSLPDLLVIDGGKGQLNAAVEVLRECGAEFIPVVGLAKRYEEIFRPDEPTPVILPRNSQGLFLMQRVRDEAHRFALQYHRQVRKKLTFASSLDEITGIGPKKKQALVRRFGTVKAIREAEVDEIAAVPGMTRTLAVRVKSML